MKKKNEDNMSPIGDNNNIESFSKRNTWVQI